MEELDELLSKILKNELMEGIVARIADDLFIGGNTREEAIENWTRVLARLDSCNIKLSPTKTHIFPSSVDILGYHKLLALSETEEPEKVKDMRSWVGLYKTFMACTPGMADFMHPFDNVTAGRESNDPITWNAQLSLDFRKAIDAIKTMQILYLPSQLLMIN